MTIIVKDDKGEVVIEKEVDAKECRIDITESLNGQIQCSVQQMIASIH
ncbi:MAG: hypothetical protein Q4A65_00180 [Bacillota bacterium]|nr:hypothetical protein [Bacillota bacterium]